MLILSNKLGKTRRKETFNLKILYELTGEALLKGWATARTPPHPYSCALCRNADYKPRN